jgi:uncharacterized membrane protein
MAFYMAKVMVAIYIVHTCLLDLIIERYVYIGLYAKWNNKCTLNPKNNWVSIFDVIEFSLCSYTIESIT